MNTKQLTQKKCCFAVREDSNNTKYKPYVLRVE